MHISRETNGKYRAHVRWTTNTGKTIKKSQTFTTRAEAKHWAKEREVSAFYRLKGTPMADALHKYREECLKPKLEEQTTQTGKTSQHKRLKMLQLMEIRLDGFTLESFNAEAAQDYKVTRLKSVSPETVRKELFFISAIFQWFRQEKLMFDLVNPIKMIKIPSTGDGRDVIHKAKEQELLREELGGEYSIAYSLLLETAMRLSELMFLRVEWMDLDDPEDSYISLPKANTKMRTARTVPLNQKARALLSELTSGRVKGPVFKITYEGMRTRFRRAKHRTGLKHLRLHDCRHTAATKYAKTLPNMLMVQQVTGHKNMQSLARYVHYSNRDVTKHMG